MSVDLQVKKGDTRDWRFALTDASSTAINLTGATVNFELQQDERTPTGYFIRQSGTGGTNSDYISISDATGGVVRITPFANDWNNVSDYGIYIGEFKVTTSGSVLEFTEDVVVDIQKAIV